MERRVLGQIRVGTAERRTELHHWSDVIYRGSGGEGTPEVQHEVLGVPTTDSTHLNLPSPFPLGPGPVSEGVGTKLFSWRRVS